MSRPTMHWSEYRDCSFWTALWHVISSVSMSMAAYSGLSCGTVPHRGCVAPRFPLFSSGLGSTLSPAIEARGSKLRSIRGHRIHSTDGVRRWRWTSVWESYRLVSPESPSGRGLPSGGSSRALGIGGEETSWEDSSPA